MGNPTYVNGRAQARISPVRRGLGIAAAAVVLILAALFTLGAWNPWGFVVLRINFHDTFLGLLVVGAGLYLTTWLLWPVQNETTQRGRLVTRVLTAVMAVVGLLTWGIAGYSYETRELASSEDGDRTLVSVGVKPRGSGADRTKELYIWSGDGLTRREVGHLGDACGPVSGRFVSADTLELRTSYGTWQFALDPEDGTPLEVLGPRCADGPVPATLGG